MASYQQLAPEERYQIYSLIKAGRRQSDIARQLGRHPGTISRELPRNRGQRGYRPHQAQAIADERQQLRVRQRIAPETWALVESRLRRDSQPGADQRLAQGGAAAAGLARVGLPARLRRSGGWRPVVAAPALSEAAAQALRPL